MKISVKAKVNDCKIKWPSEDYIDEYEKYNLKCKIKKDDFGIIFDKYELKLKGEKHDIERYLTYLQRKGFKIEKIPPKSQFAI